MYNEYVGNDRAAIQHLADELAIENIIKSFDASINFGYTKEECELLKNAVRRHCLFNAEFIMSRTEKTLSNSRDEEISLTNINKTR